MELNRHHSTGIDLHIHSTASDGTLSPPEILSLARKLRLSAISITDHDAIEGVKEAFAYGIPTEVEFITGIELSASFPLEEARGSLHILGYGIDPEHSELNAILMAQQEARRNRNPRILEKLGEMGIHLSLESIREKVGNGQIGRPHLAQELVRMGIVSSIDQAFKRYLGTKGPAYVDKPRIPCEQAINIIRRSGGVAVPAHPFLIPLPPSVSLNDLILMLKPMGLGGVEALYPEHPPEIVVSYQALARHHGLLITGGTDFHGAIKPDTQMGTGAGDFHVPHHLFERLKAAIAMGVSDP